MVGRRPERLNAVHCRPVTGSRNHLAVRMGDRDADAARHTLTDPATPAAIVFAPTTQPEVANHVARGSDAFIGDEGVCRYGPAHFKKGLGRGHG